jgi:hypothetical protein
MPKKMSDVAVEKTGHLLAVASPNQAQSLAEQAVAKLTPTAAKVVAVKATEQMLKDKQKGWETELFTAIEGMANEILGHSQNSYYREIASDILSGVGELLTAASAAAALQNTPLANAPEKEIVAAAHATEAPQ